MHGNRRRQCAFTLALALCLGCSGGTLTRSKAQTLIEAAPQFQPTSVLNLTDEEFEAGRKAGYFISTPGEWQYCKLTPQGQKFFAIEHLYPGLIKLRTKTPVRYRVLEITGITEDSATEREVGYTWGWNLEDFPEDLRPIFQDVRKKGAAELRKYDDGWRVEMFRD